MTWSEEMDRRLQSRRRQLRDSGGSNPELVDRIWQARIYLAARMGREDLRRRHERAKAAILAEQEAERQQPSSHLPREPPPRK